MLGSLVEVFPQGCSSIINFILLEILPRSRDDNKMINGVRNEKIWTRAGIGETLAEKDGLISVSMVWAR